jgi:hypothetical protein
MPAPHLARSRDDESRPAIRSGAREIVMKLWADD